MSRLLQHSLTPYPSYTYPCKNRRFDSPEVGLGSVNRLLSIIAILASLSVSSAAQETSKASLDYNEVIFGVVTAMNSCGYDQELNISDSMRLDVRRQVNSVLQSSAEATVARDEMCKFYSDHRRPDASQDLAQYISLALNLDEPPKFKPKIRESDLPPDASYVLGFVPLFVQFYQTANLHEIYRSHQAEYELQLARFHDLVSNLLTATDVYLKLPLSGFTGRLFKIYVEPMAAPGQVNARNYRTDYFMVVSPGSNGQLKLDQMRHSYLHFILDPLTQRRAAQMKRLEPLLLEIQDAPLDEAYKRDVTLLVAESMIRAVEAHLIPGKDEKAEEKRNKAVETANAAGFILTRHFYDELTKFRTDETGLTESYPDWLYGIEIDKERKRAANTQFARTSNPDVVSTATVKKRDPLDEAEQKLFEGDVNEAQRLANLAISERGTERAYLILGQAAALKKDKDAAVQAFQQAVKLGKDPRVLAWAHVYLGRIYDVQEEREQAVAEYQAALKLNDIAATAKTAAERGLKQPYEPPVSRSQPGQENSQEQEKDQEKQQ